jgi:hypothetical protein
MKMALQPVEIGLIGLCTALAALFVYECVAPLPPFDTPEVRLPPIKTAADVSPYAPPPQASFAEIDARPLFNPLRIPVEASAVPGTASSAQLPPPEVTLIGVILDGSNRLALVKAPGAPFATSVAVGGTVAGWEVSEIGPDKAVLHAGTREYQLRLDDKRQAQPSQPPAMGKSPQ